jgi:dCMP deaminase
MIINSRINRVVYLTSYPDTDALDFFNDAGVEIINLPVSRLLEDA